MKKILCYGDSNTYGFNPQNGSRYGENERWCGILKNKLNQKFEIIEDGLNNRKGFVDNNDGVKFCAKKHLFTVLNNIDILVFALGVNDLQFSYNVNLSDIEAELNVWFKYLKEKNIKTIVFSPVILSENILNSSFSCLFDKDSIVKSAQLAKIYQRTAQNYDFIYFDTNAIAQPSDIDGLHYEKESHQIIAQELEQIIKNIY